MLKYYLQISSDMHPLEYLCLATHYDKPRVVATCTAVAIFGLRHVQENKNIKYRKKIETYSVTAHEEQVLTVPPRMGLTRCTP